MTSTDLTTFLGLPEQSEQNKISDALTAFIITAATTQAHHASTTTNRDESKLSELYSVLASTGTASFLEPLTAIPYLLPVAAGSTQAAQPARDIISLCGECTSPKEVIIATQEAVERVQALLEEYDEDEDEDQDQGDAQLSAIPQLIVLLDLYTVAIPKIKLRQKSASETIRPLLQEMSLVIQHAGSRCTVTQGRAIIHGSTELVSKVVPWSKIADDLQVADVLRDFLDTVIDSCGHCLASACAQRAFERCFPRLVMRSSVLPRDWEDSVSIMADALAAYTLLATSLKQLATIPSNHSLLILVHQTEFDVGSIPTLLSTFLPILLTNIQSNHLLDPTLAFLLTTLHTLAVAKPPIELGMAILGPLSASLPPLASANPDPSIRHYSFRITSLLISLSPPLLQLELLRDLATNETFPRMRVAAVGLIRDAFLAAMNDTFGGASPSSSLIQGSMATKAKANVLLSPRFWQVFAPVLLRTNPPGWLDVVDDTIGGITLEKFLENTYEVSRIVESMALYYVVLQRDKMNLTGIRDRGNIANVEKTLLTPLRKALARWALESGEEGTSEGDELHGDMRLAPIHISLERIDDAKAALADV